MADGVTNSYSIDGVGVFDKYSGKLVNSDDTKSSSLGQSDFLKLIVEQMKNQDFNNPTDNAEFIAQMAQFSSLEAMQTLSLSTQMSYGSSLVGQYVTVQTTDGSFVTGKVDCLALDASTPYVIISNKQYPLSNVVEIVTKEIFDTIQDAMDSTDKEESTEETDKVTETETDTTEDTQSKIDALVEQYEATTADLYAELMMSIEEIQAGNPTDDSDAYTSATVNATSYSSLADFDVEMSVAKAGYVENDYNYANANSSNARATSKVTGGNTSGITDDYQLCLQKANETNTNMKDLKYIFNSSITGKIDTSNVLGQTASGRKFTDIGYSGQGRLGEVVTWADGTQRVEIISPYGYSTYFTTTGDYTLDEICDFDVPPGYYKDKFTGSEISIRYFSRVYTDAEKQAMASYEKSLRAQGLIQ